MTSKKHFLQPEFNKKKSFNNNAYFLIKGAWGQNVQLFSYNKLVAEIGYTNKEKFVCMLTGDYISNFYTFEHVREFLNQFGFGDYTIKDIENEAFDLSDYNGEFVKMLVRP